MEVVSLLQASTRSWCQRSTGKGGTIAVHAILTSKNKKEKWTYFSLPLPVFFLFHKQYITKTFEVLYFPLCAGEVISSLHVLDLKESSGKPPLTAHCYSQLMCSNPSSSLCCPSLALETLSLDHSPRLNELWQPFLGICFSFAQFLWSLASSPKSARESSFSHFLCAWDRQCCTVPQASGWSRTQELLRPTAEMLHSKRTETRDAVSKPLSATVSKTPLLSWVVTIY